MTWLVVLPALLLLAVVVQDAFEVMLLPRRVTRPYRLMRAYYRTGWAIWLGLARHIGGEARREHLLSVFGPLSMLVLFGIWSSGLIVSFGMLEWSAQPAGAASSLGEQLYMSGVTFFTLGYGDVVPHSGVGRGIAVLEAGVGIGFIAIVIGYLPVLYQLFAAREAHVMRLDARAGSPPSATTMLCRHAQAGAVASLDVVLAEWEGWAAQLLESHLSYPMLAYYRSQHDDQSWLAALIAVMDTCALVLVGVEGVAPLQARMTFMMARQVVVEMARWFGVAPSQTRKDRMPQGDFARMEAAFARCGVTWTGAADAEAVLTTLRGTYEPLLDALGGHLLLHLPGILADEDTSDHLEQGHRGLIARLLVEELSTRTAPPPSHAGPGAGTQAWRRLRRRLFRHADSASPLPLGEGPGEG